MNIIMSRAIQQHHHHQPQPHLQSYRLPLAQNAAVSANHGAALSPSSPLDFTERIPFHEIELSNETLGSGSFGTVFKGRWQGRSVAIKQFKTREEIDSFLVEVKQLSCVKHANIVKLYGASTLSDTAYLIMEYAEGGSLNHLLHECKQQEYDLRHACSWAMQTAKGVAYLHGIRPKPIMHRDLKPANLLLFSRGKILKICDFGTACIVKTQMTNNTGSASYMAPEVFATSSYLETGDVFSWSIIFWEILARRHPYSQRYSNPYQILWSVKQEGIRPNELESCPRIIWKLITKSWNKDPNKRPSMREVADEMEFIYSLTERSTTSTNGIQKQKSPHRQIFVPAAHHDINHHHHHQHQHNHQQQQHYHQLQQQQLRQQEVLGGLTEMKIQQSLNGSPEETESIKRKLFNRSRALLYHLDILKRRAEEIEAVRYDRSQTSMDLINEFEVLKKETELKKKELEQRHTSISNTRSSSTGQS